MEVVVEPWHGLISKTNVCTKCLLTLGLLCLSAKRVETKNDEVGMDFWKDGGFNSFPNIRNRKISDLKQQGTTQLPDPSPPPSLTTGPVMDISKWYGNLADLYTLPYVDVVEVPIFWHIPRSGGTTLQDDLIHCVGLVDASEIGVAVTDVDGIAHGNDETLLAFRAADGGYHVNVDTTSLDGITRAKMLGLAESGLADVVFSSRIFDCATLFSTTHKGRMFALFRDPIERAVSMFYHLRSATWEKTYDPTLANITIEEYAYRTETEHNWMTRLLMNELEGELLDVHLEQAKEILRNKCLIGLLSKLEISLNRFDRFFGWDLTRRSEDGVDRMGCERTHVHNAQNAEYHPLLDPSSDAWKHFRIINNFDIQLYEYAVSLFEEQAELF